MIPLAVRSSKETISVNFPTDWPDLTFRQFCNVFTDWYGGDMTDVTAFLEMVTGVEQRVWNNCHCEPAEILRLIKPFENLPDLEKAQPAKYITILSKQVKVPTNAGLEPYMAKILVQSTINANLGKEHDLLLIIPDVLAAYMYAPYYGKEADVEKDKMDDLREWLMDCPLYDVYPAGRFFFLKWAKSSQSNPKSSKICTRLIRWLRGSKSSKSMA